MVKKNLKQSGMTEQITTEIRIMYSLSHENIVKLFNHFEDDNNIYLVIDYAPGVIKSAIISLSNYIIYRVNSGTSSKRHQERDSPKRKSPWYQQTSLLPY